VSGARARGGGEEPKLKSNCWKVMETPRYHREQAEDCLELARLMSDPHAASILRSAAARHFEQASELEKLTVDSPRSLPRSRYERATVRFSRQFGWGRSVIGWTGSWKTEAAIRSRSGGGLYRRDPCHRI
jgi:hypothetical protein